MGTTLRRKLYTRGSSFETTIPMPLLFSVDKSRKNDVVFTYDDLTQRWYVEIAPGNGSGKSRPSASQPSTDENEDAP